MVGVYVAGKAVSLNFGDCSDIDGCELKVGCFEANPKASLAQSVPHISPNALDDKHTHIRA